MLFMIIFSFIDSIKSLIHVHKHTRTYIHTYNGYQYIYIWGTVNSVLDKLATYQLATG